VPILNFLPIVPFARWLSKDGRAVIQSRCSAEVDGELNNFLRELGAPATVLLGTALSDVFARLIDVLEPRKRRQYEERAAKLMRRWEVANSPTSSIDEIKGVFPKQYAAVVRELLTHKLAGYYHLCRVEQHQPEDCFVVL